MNLDLSALVGVRLFLDRIVDDLAQGRSTVVAGPLGGMGELELLVLSVADGRGCFLTERVYPQNTSDPLKLLCEQFCVSSCSDPRHPNLPDLLNAEAFQGRLIAVSGLDVQSWEPWRDFLTSYSDASRRIPEHDRAVFLACLVGLPVTSLPKNDLTLRCHEWRDVLCSDDVRAFSAHLLRARGMRPNRARILASVISAFALWDLDVAELLCGLDDWQIFSPEPQLRDLASRREWTTDVETSWERGTAGEVDGMWAVHSALLALREDQEALSNRLWTGQVGVLLPRLEQERVAMIKKYIRFLDVPFETPFGIIDNPLHFELAHLRSQLKSAPIPPRAKAKLDVLVRIRNALAHLEPADLDDLAEVGFLRED